MYIKNCTSKLFYQHGFPHLTLSRDVQRTLFHYHGMPLGEQSLQQGRTDEPRLLSADQNRSVLATQASKYQQHSYAPYGHNVLLDQAYSLLGFNGELRQYLTGHYLLGNGYRPYSPALRRFCSTDNLSPFGAGGVNAYAYCAGDPVNRTDPTGHMFYSGRRGTTHYPGLHKMAGLPDPSRPPSPIIGQQRPLQPRSPQPFSAAVGSVVGQGSLIAEQGIRQVLTFAETQIGPLKNKNELTARKFMVLGGDLEDRGLIHASEIAMGFASRHATHPPDMLKSYNIPPKIISKILQTSQQQPLNNEEIAIRVIANSIRAEL